METCKEKHDQKSVALYKLGIYPLRIKKKDFLRFYTQYKMYRLNTQSVSEM